EDGDGSLDLAGITHIDWAHLYAKRRRQSLYRGELAGSGSEGGIANDRRTPYAGRHVVKPVALPPGRARLSTKPAPTGSTTFTNTIGTMRVACSNGPTAGLPVAKMTSDLSATNSAAYLRRRSSSPAAHRVLIWMFRPSVQPNCMRPRRNAALRACPTGLSGVR